MRRLLTALGASVILVVAGAAVPASAHANVLGENVIRHLRHLEAAAGPAGREPGSPGFAKSQDYVRARLAAAGYTVREQQFTFTYTETLAADWTGPDGVRVDAMVVNYTVSTPPGGIRAEVVALPPAPAVGCTPADYPSTVAGKIVVVVRGGCSFTQKQATAGAAGAVAVLIYNNEPGLLYGTLLGPGQGVVPTGALTAEQGARLAELSAGGDYDVVLNLRQLVEPRSTSNLFVDTPGPADRVLVVGGHLDSWPGAPGINDNGSGAAAVLELALIAKRVQLPTRMRFAWWSAEEWGQIGSESYLKSLPQPELAAIRGYVDLSKLGSPNYIRGVLDGAPDIARALELGFDVQRKNHKRVDLAGKAHADWVPFHDRGIAVGGLFSGSELLKTPEEAAMFGGTAGQPYDPCQHKRCDTVDGLDHPLIGQNTTAALVAMIELARRR